MFGQTFYHKTLRKNVILFGTLFNDIYITRTLTDGTPVESLKVPISYGPKEKTLARVNQDPNLSNEFRITLPRLAFEMTGITYDNQRKLPTANKSYAKQASAVGDEERRKYMYNPVPYNINFSLYAMVRNAEDGTRILEQILPFFSPEWTATVNLIPDMDVALDIPTIIQDVSLTDTYEGSLEDDRLIIWTMNFVMKTYLFGPIKTQSAIRVANLSFFDATNGQAISDPNLNPQSAMGVYPGMAANGSPTTNAEITIPPNDIKETDTWDYIVDKRDY